MTGSLHNNPYGQSSGLNPFDNLDNLTGNFASNRMDFSGGNRSLHRFGTAGLVVAAAMAFSNFFLISSTSAQPIQVNPHPGVAFESPQTIIDCHRPPAPACMADNTTFVSADRMSTCQFEVKEYVDRTMTYLHCLNDENRKTGEELTRNVDGFNCRLSGGRSCP